MKRLVPYTTLRRSDGVTSLELHAARVDDDPLPVSLVNRSERVVAVHGVGYADWRSARLSMRMHVPVVPNPEARGWRDVRAAVAVGNRSSNIRAVTPLFQESDGLWTGDVRIDRDEHKGRTQLTGLVTATVDGVPGRLIGGSEEAWTVDVDSRTAHREQDMRVVEADFGDEAHPHLNAYRHNEWTVDAAGEVPTIYLNTAVEGIARLLTRTDRMAPAESALRKVLSAKLGTEVWMTLFYGAVDEIRVEDDTPQWPGGWRDATLRSMLPDVFPDRSPEDALRELVGRRHGDVDGRDMHARVLFAAGRQARSARSLGEAVREVTKVSGQ